MWTLLSRYLLFVDSGVTAAKIFCHYKLMADEYHEITIFCLKMCAKSLIFLQKSGAKEVASQVFVELCNLYWQNVECRFILWYSACSWFHVWPELIYNVEDQNQSGCKMWWEIILLCSCHPRVRIPPQFLDFHILDCGNYNCHLL